jgi:prefoldin subunit 5
MHLQAVSNTYEHELEVYKKRCRQLEEQQVVNENQIHKLRRNVLQLQEYQHKYLQIKERYDLLIYKRFMRSAEQIPYDSKQQ